MPVDNAEHSIAKNVEVSDADQFGASPTNWPRIIINQSQKMLTDEDAEENENPTQLRTNLLTECIRMSGGTSSTRNANLLTCHWRSR
jgi:hypothetical protein